MTEKLLILLSIEKNVVPLQRILKQLNWRRNNWISKECFIVFGDIE